MAHCGHPEHHSGAGSKRRSQTTRAFVAPMAARHNVSMYEAFDTAADFYELVMWLETDDRYRRIIRILIKHPRCDELEGHPAILVDADAFYRRGLSSRNVDLLFDMYLSQLREFIAKPKDTAEAYPQDGGRPRLI